MSLIRLGSICLSGDGPNTFNTKKAVRELNKHLDNPDSPVFQAMVHVVDAGQHLVEKRGKDA